tara:strand:+ start:338 stop:592 length:255 start_codon:yes stop_codon:yes gene_type:complete
MKTLFQKMRAHRSRWVDQPIQQQADDWRLKAMVVDGQMYVEAPEVNACEGCAFHFGACSEGWAAGKAAFGGCCTERQVIYLKAA